MWGSARRAALVGVVAGLLSMATPVPPAAATPAYGEYQWPVHGPVVQAYQSLPSPYTAGHRGLDLAASPGTSVRAANDGVVAFAGQVGGALYISIDHPDGVRTTYSWVASIGVHKNQEVLAGAVIGTTGLGHPTGVVASPHLHLGARYGGEYLDPMLLLEGIDVVDLIRLAPLELTPI